MNISKTLQENCWSIICDGFATGGDDYGIHWLVVGYFMQQPCERVIGFATENQGLAKAIENALDTIRDDPYNYLYEYKR